MFFLQGCKSDAKTDILTIPVNVDKESPLALSDITDKIESIELEVTDESLIQNPSSIFYSSEYIIVQQSKSIMLFNSNGSFIRLIGTVGQGPRDFISIGAMAVDFENKRIFIYSSQKFICYDFDGHFINKSSDGHFGYNYFPSANYKDKLLLMCESFKIETEKITPQRVLFFVNDDLIKTDSIIVEKFKPSSKMEVGINTLTNEFVTNVDNNTYLYYFALFPDNFVSDTLYQLIDNHLIPNLNIRFKNRGLKDGRKEVIIANIFRNSRYVITIYSRRSDRYLFVHDLKTGESYNIKEGITDDIYTVEKVIIRPLPNDANKYYYLHTHLNGDDYDEPNPTLYVGTLKN